MLDGRKRLLILGGIGVVLAVVLAFQHLLPRGDDSRDKVPPMAPAGAPDGRQPPPAAASGAAAASEAQYAKLFAISQQPGPQDVPVLKKAIQSPSWEDRHAAVTGLGRLKDKGDPPALLTVLTNAQEKASLANYYDEVYIGSAYQGARSLAETGCPWIWRLSQTQFNVFWNTPGHGQNYHYVANGGYKPDSNPNLYYYLMEDMGWQSGGGDQDFWDVMYKVETDDINYKLTVVSGYTGYTHNLLLGNGPGKKILIADCYNKNGVSVEVKGKGVASYGVNTVADQVLPGTGGKILILDYDVITAAGSPYDETGDRAKQLAKDWQPDPNNPANGPRFARHMRKADVLFTDGSVKLMPIADIHPGIPKNCAQYWDPK